MATERGVVIWPFPLERSFAAAQDDMVWDVIERWVMHTEDWVELT